MVRRRRSYDRYGKVDGEVTYSQYNAAGFAAAVPSLLPGSVAIDPCHDRDILGQNRLNNNSPAPVPAVSAPAEGPRLFAEINQTASKSVLRPNAPFVFDGERTQGRSFLHAVKTYVRLVPEGFLVEGPASEEKAVHFAMSYMAKDAAQRWAERQSAKIPFPFPTWADFVREFRLRFVEENEQDHALAKLESRGYFM